MKELRMQNGAVRDTDETPVRICNACQRPGASVEGVDGEPYHYECRAAIGK